MCSAEGKKLQSVIKAAARELELNVSHCKLFTLPNWTTNSKRNRVEAKDLCVLRGARLLGDESRKEGVAQIMLSRLTCAVALSRRCVYLCAWIGHTMMCGVSRLPWWCWCVHD